MADAPADPVFKLWGKDPHRQVPAEEILPVLVVHFTKRYLSHWNRWDQTSWHKERCKGLEAYSRYEADFRLRQHPKHTFTLKEFKRFHLCDSIQLHGEKAIADDYYDDLWEYERQNSAREFLSLITKKMNQKGRNPNADAKLYAILYDRGDIPFEFWTNQAAANFLTKAFQISGSARSFDREQIKKWKSELLHLKESEPFIVSDYHPVKGEIIEFNMEAAKIHGLPLPTPEEMADLGK